MLGNYDTQKAVSEEEPRPVLNLQSITCGVSLYAARLRCMQGPEEIVSVSSLCTEHNLLRAADGSVWRSTTASTLELYNGRRGAMLAAHEEVRHATQTTSGQQNISFVSM